MIPMYPEYKQKEIYDSIKLPQRSTSRSAGYDFYLPFDIAVSPEKEVFIPLGIKVYMNGSNVLALFPRSSLGFRFGFRLMNTAGIIDADYVDNPDNEGQIMIKFTVDHELTLTAGSKICQGIFFRFDVTDDDSACADREGGIGSTGK